MTRYDASIIIDYAENLYRQADMTLISTLAVGALLGGGIGGAINQPLGILVGAVACGFLGYLIGQNMASQMKLQAQVALCQVQIEQNTRGLRELLSAAAAQKSDSSTKSIEKPKPAAERQPGSSSSMTIPLDSKELPGAATRICPQCGAKVNSTANKCQRCGLPLDEQDEQPV
jgi:hypothetical protein